MTHFEEELNENGYILIEMNSCLVVDIPQCTLETVGMVVISGLKNESDVEVIKK